MRHVLVVVLFAPQLLREVVILHQHQVHECLLLHREALIVILAQRSLPEVVIGIVHFLALNHRRSDPALVARRNSKLLSFRGDLIKISNACSAFISAFQWIHESVLFLIARHILWPRIIDDLLVESLLMLLQFVLVLAFVLKLQLAVGLVNEMGHLGQLLGLSCRLEFFDLVRESICEHFETFLIFWLIQLPQKFSFFWLYCQLTLIERLLELFLFCWLCLGRSF